MKRCSFESGIIVFALETDPREGAPFGCYHLSTPTASGVAFDDHRLVANAGLMLPATLALRLGLGELVDRYLDLGNAPGRANTGDKLMTLVASALAGGGCIDDADALRSGGLLRHKYLIMTTTMAIWKRYYHFSYHLLLFAASRLGSRKLVQVQCRILAKRGG